MVHIAALPDRAVIAVSGGDRISFLQGLLSNDVGQVAPGQAVWTAMLTPQGKYLADFFILDGGESLLLDCAAAQAVLVEHKLRRFRLRARVELNDVSAAWRVHVAWGGIPKVPNDAVAAPDPRLPNAGVRILAATALATDCDAVDWERHRLALGLPDGNRDLDVEKSVLLEAGFDELNGISWTKGCYMGQELTARTKYRGLIKRVLVPIEVAGRLPAPGTPILTEHRAVGTLRSGLDGRALATLRIDAMDLSLTCAGMPVRVHRPDWLVLPA